MGEGFLTIKDCAYSTFEINKSVFIANARHVEGTGQATEYVNEIRAKYSDATHNCYAFVADDKGLSVKYSDAGEPQGTAGIPILSVIKNKKLFQTAVVITRYFGGIKLGANGLIRAYSTAASQVLDSAETVGKNLRILYSVELGYSELSRIEKLIVANNITVLEKEYLNGVSLKLAVLKSEMKSFENSLTEITNGKAVIRKIREEII